MMSLLLILAAGATAWAFLRFKKNPQQGTGLLALSVIALITLLVLSFFVHSDKSEGYTALQKSMEGESVVAEIMGRQATRLVPEGGRVLIFTSSESVARRVRGLGMQREAQLGGLKRGLAKNFTLTVFELPPTQGPYFGFLHAKDLLDALRTYPDTKAIVIFLGVPQPLPDLAGAGGVGPKVICRSMPEELARQELRAGHIHAAVVYRTTKQINPAPVTKGDDVQQTFDAHYQLLTPEN